MSASFSVETGSSVARTLQEEAPRTPAPSTCRTRWRHNLLPFLKLRHTTEEPFWRQCCQNRAPRSSETFLAGLGFWLLAVAILCYLLLTISSTTFVMKEVGHSNPPKYEATSKFPGCGKHLYYFLLMKRFVEVVLLNHLCGNLMEPLPEMSEKRFLQLEQMRPYGVVHWLQKAVNCVLRRQHREKWLSSFFPDYTLLLGVGACGLVYVVVLCARKMDVHAFQATELFIIARNEPGSAALILLDSVAYAYTMVLVMGFLLETLEENVVAKAGCQREFAATFSLFMMLWSLNFLTTLYDRQIYSGAWGDPAMPWFRVLAAAAQVFVTHSMVMMGAVLLGHSAHVRRTPDLTWRTFLIKLLPSAGLLIVAVTWVGLRRRYHEHAECSPQGYLIFAQTWSYFKTAFASLSGISLLLLTFSGVRREADTEADFISQLDYDSMLILVTVSLAVIGNMNNIFAMEASRLVSPFLAAVGQLFGPVGLSTFAFSAWKDPPHLGEHRSKGLWLAFVFAGVMFLDFQTMEDCEIASDLPGCCAYPGSPGYNKYEHRDLKCNKDLRCMVTDLVAPCYLGDEESMELINITALKEEFNVGMCDVLADRWFNYTLVDDTGYSYAMQDAESEAYEESTAYRLFQSIGNAASVEMYFTIFGVLLKVIFLTQHPNSEQILLLDAHHHHAEPQPGQSELLAHGSHAESLS